MQNKINKVAILGGTHGNELTGVYLEKWWIKEAQETKRKSFSTKVLLSNPEAVKRCSRYIDQDLNRCFTLDDLQNKKLQNYENKRARELNELLGPKDSKKPNFDFLIDLHSTTSNMGVTVIITDDDSISFFVAAQLQKKNPKRKIVQMIENKIAQPYITSIVPHAITLEVGPVPQAALYAELLLETKKVVLDVLDIIENFNTEKVVDMSCKLEVYDYIKSLDYPKDIDGEISAMVHPEIQGADYKEIRKGDPLFIAFSGETIYYEQEEPMCPIFVNEAAYYEKGIAMMLTRKVRVTKQIQ